MLDLDPYSYDLPKPLPSVRAVGWLAGNRPFQNGNCPPDILGKIKRLILRERVNQMRGTHDCEFCQQSHIKVNISGKLTLLGAAEVWVPDSNGQVIFAAPNLILHYIVEHKYLPPESFMKAVREFDEESTWSGEAIYEKLSRAAYQ